jgi:tetratricopeptide (TPR) repeat protein
MLSNGSRAIACIAGVLGLSAAVGVPGASAAPPAGSAPEVQAARELFGLAEADEDAGRWQEALQKLRRVLGTKDTPGVRYHIALCEERLGKLAAAEADFAVADASARAAEAADVLRLVGGKLAELGPRVPHVTVRVAPPAADASVTIDGRTALAGEATAVDPGTHEVEVTATARDGRTPSKVTFAVAEGEAKTVDVALAPAPVAPAPPAPAAASTSTAARARDSGITPRTAAAFEGLGAVLLVGVGVAAYEAGGVAHDQAARSCALVASQSTAACDSYRLPVRAWDWVAIGAWAGAGGLATWAVVTWATAPSGTSGVAVGAGPLSLRVEGSF